MTSCTFRATYPRDMKASVNWLRSLVPGLDAPAEQMADRLTNAGLEVEGISRTGVGLERVRVASVLSAKPHPRRPHLQVVTVSTGAQTHTVICGAPNVPAPGGLVCLAEVGTTLPTGAPITARDFDGVVSEGMLCSEAELGISDDGSGLLILDGTQASQGQALTEALPAIADVIFDIGVTPNRPDALGHIGLARDLAALYRLPFEVPQPESPVRMAGGTIEDWAAVEVQDFDRCPHYGALVVTDVTIGPSPLWLRARLSSLGIRPVSNIVDITNLVLLEFGHPMHAFDLDLLRGRRIVVRRARPGEKITTLDRVQRTLDPDDLLICDGEGPVGIAGVMGGENTEIRPTTRNVLFECAYFDPRSIRRTSRRHSIHTESSHRFERGIDRNDAVEVLAHAGALATRLAAASAVPGAIHARRDAWVSPQVVLRKWAMDRLLGTDVPLAEARETLTRLGFECTDLRDGSKPALQVAVPSYRPDVTREADLIEEVARIRGLDTIPTELPAVRPQPPRGVMQSESRVRQAAVGLGLSEAVTYGFVSPRDLQLVGAPEATVKLINPLTEDRTVMRTSLMPGLLETASRARRHGERSARLFTIGALFMPAQEPGLPQEQPGFGALLTGGRDAYLARAQDYDVYDAKGLALELIERVTRRTDLEIRPWGDGAAPRLWHPRAAASIHCQGHELGRFGLVHPDVLQHYELGTATIAVELLLSSLRAVGVATPKFRPIPRVPATSRDLALVLDESVAAAEVQAVIRNAAGPLCESVELFDVFKGKGIPEGQRSLAFHVVYRDPDATTRPDEARTLTDEEVDARHEEVINQAMQQLRATLR